MKFSYNWLKQLVDFDKTPQELADDLSTKSVEITNIERFGGDFLENVVVGEIKEIKPHPNADKLKITIVDVGARHAVSLQIVCGAPNIAVGQKVPVALVGAELPLQSGGQAMGEIKEAKIRGVESYGMICAQDELALGSDHSGIMILDPSISLGTPLADIYNDWILDGDILPNRGDLQNHFGLAREVSAIYDKKLKTPSTLAGRQEIKKIKDHGDNIEKTLEVENIDTDACPLYAARIIKGVKIAPSPSWMQARLITCGMNPINNVVDITNYVMLEYGNPLHAFDADKITKVDEKYKITVRLSKKREKITTLDGEMRNLPEGLLIIADDKGPIAVAGVMGGENSGINEDTVDIILESATFNSTLIRKSQRELGIRTGASSRFEKGLQPYLARVSLDKAALLIKEICGGEIVEGKIIAGEYSDKKKEIKIDTEKIRKFLSIDIKDIEIFKILENLGFEIRDKVVLAPLWRGDINIWQDIAEEVGRIYGYDKVPEEKTEVKIKPETEKVLYFEQSAKKYLADSGLTEVFSYSILSDELVKMTNMADHHFEITNPLNENDYILRSGLWNGLLKYAAENAKKYEKFAFFDLSKVYLAKDEGGSTSLKEVEPPSKEERRLAMLLYGEKDKEGIFVLKKYLEDFAENFGISLEIRNLKLEIREYMHPGRCGGIYYKDKMIGEIFEIHPLVLENLGLRNRAWCAEINFDILANDAKNIEEKFEEIESEITFKEYSRYEISKRDMAIVVDDKITAGEIFDVIKSIDNKIISVELFDEYKSDKLGKDKKSLAYHLIFQAKDKTLDDKKVDDIFQKILDNLGKKFGVKLRE